MTTNFSDREGWLSEAADMLFDDVLMPAVEDNQLGYSKPLIRISCGWPRGSRGAKSLRGHTYKKADSTSNINEIFISPELDEPYAVLDVLAHELIHAILDDNKKHTGPFRLIAQPAGFEGPMSDTHAGERLAAVFAEMMDILGDYPHQKLDLNKAKPGSRQLKCECIECGLVVRMSRKAIDQVESQTAQQPGGFGFCPAGCVGASLKLDV